MNNNTRTSLRVAIALAWLIGSLHGAYALEVTLRLVRADAPDQLVSTAITKIDVDAELEKLKAEQAKAAGTQARNGGKPMTVDTEIKPKAEFDQYCNYMRGIVIDQKHPFQLMYESNGHASFLGRSDVITLSLADGEHRIDPGAHVFTVAEGKISTSDQSLRPNGKTLDIITYPVSILAVDGSTVRDMPAELRRLPVALRILHGDEELIPKEQYLAPTATFKHLRLYMLTNSIGEGYRLTPSERHFYLTEKGVEILDANGKVTKDVDIPVENGFTITIPKTAVPIVLRGEKCHVSISGASGQLSLDANPMKKEIVQNYYAYSAIAGATITAGDRVSVTAKLHGDFGAFPRRKIIIDATAAESHEPRIVQIALPSYETETGKALRIRVQFTDSFDAATLSPPEVAAFLWQPSILQDDGMLRAAPDTNSNLSEWRQLRLEGTPEPDIYNIVMPDVASNVYWLRLVVDKRGCCSPASPLHADFIQGIINSAARTNLSIFCPSGRHAYLNGADLPISVVVKSSTPVPASRLHLSLKRGSEEFPLVDQDIPVLEPGCHPFHFILQGSATGALSPGDYSATATLGGLTANTWSIHIARPRLHTAFPIYGTGRFSHFDVDGGKTYLNVPPSIAAANEARELMQRNASILGREVDTVLIDWYGFHPLSVYSGRDSSSEVAEVEKVLRHGAALPSHEVYYYQNHFESVHEALMREGIGEVNGVVCNLAMISLMHSVEKDVHSEMRKFQLIAQIGRKFENFDGMALVYPNTDPLGNSEIVDAGRDARLQVLYKNFKAKYGFDAPTMAGGRQFMEALLRGQPIKEELANEAKQWEAWQLECNKLLGDFYGIARKAVDPLTPGLKLFNEGPGWGYTGNATYPGTANANQNPLMVWTGFSDFGYNNILEPFLRPKFLQLTGNELWGTIFTYAGMHGNLKKHVIEHLAAGVHAIGYAGNHPLVEVDGRSKTYLPEDYQQIHDFLQTYGPMFRQASPRAQIAVLYPFHQTMYELMPIFHDKWKANLGVPGTYTCLIQLAQLGYDSEVLSEEMIDKGELDRFKVVIAPALHHLLPQHKAALEKFAAKGNAVLLGSLSTLVPTGAKLIDDDFEELGEVATRSRDPFDIDHAWWFSQMRSRIPKLREALQPLQPFAKPETDQVLIQSNTAGDGRYTYVWNMSYPSFMGTPRVTGNPEVSSYDGEANEQTIMPQRPTVLFPSNYITYDLLAQKPIDSTQQKDGRIPVSCDLSFSSFRIYVSLPQAIAALRMEAPETATQGTQFSVKITALDKAGNPINAAIPLRISLLDAAGKSVDVLHASAIGTCESRLSVPLGFAAGKWTLAVDDMLSGHHVDASLTVDQPQKLPFASAIKPLAQVDVQRPDLVHAFLEARKKDQEPVWILLSEGQRETHSALAEETVKQLATLGIKAEIKNASSPEVYSKEERIHLWQGWSEMAPAQYIEHDILLLGGEGQNPLLEELQEHQLLTRCLTASYPGAGRGVLTVVRSPFAFNRDVLCVLGPDSAGLRAALGELSKLAVPLQQKTEPEAVKLAATQKDTVNPPSAPFANVDGAPVEVIAASASGDRIAFGTMGYANNIFVFDTSGKLIFEDKIGHINTQGMELFPDGQRMSVLSDGTLYLRETDGSFRWRLNFQRHEFRDYIDPAGRYLVISDGTAMRVLDTNLKPLWAFDEFDKCENSMEILFGRAARFMTAANQGNTLIYRLTGKAPGIAGRECDDIIFCEALTGKELRRAPVNFADIREFVHFPPDRRPVLKTLLAVNEGKFFLAEITGLKNPLWVLLNSELKPVAYPRFELPGYMGGTTEISQRALLSNRQLVLTVGDTLALTNADWTAQNSVNVGSMILSLLLDETRQRLLISDASGHLTAFDYNLKKLWETDLHRGAVLALLKDGRIAAGTTGGTALLLDAEGHILWSQSLNRYAPPEEIEKRWAELESLPSIQGAGHENWWEQLAQNAELGEDLAKLNGACSKQKPMSAQFKGVPFGTYLVEWHYGKASPSCSMTLDLTEVEKTTDGKPGEKLSRLARSGQAQEREFVDHAILRLGDRPDLVTISVQSMGEKEAASQVTVRQIKFPSEDVIRTPALYRNMGSIAAAANPAAIITMFPVPADQWTGWWCEPMCLVNGRMLEREPLLLNGKWFGGNNTQQVSSNSAHIPCYVEITMPKKRFISHVVIAEDPDLARLETMTVDVYVETPDKRHLTDFEARQEKKGYWINTVKRKGNTSYYNVYKLPKTYYTNKVRVYLLNGYSSVDEIELYESVPQFTKTSKEKEERADAEHHP